MDDTEIPDLPYSRAPRCPHCGGRAQLTEQIADRLVAASGGGLESFLCPESNTWHVWAPNVERPQLKSI